MIKCSHTVAAEFRTTPDSYLPEDTTISLEETLDMPLHLTRMPAEINSISPTPLDPYSLRIHGLPYDNEAMKFMMNQLKAASEDIPSKYDKDVLRAGYEIEYQHVHRMKKNDEAMSRWREFAAADPLSKMLTHQEAEEILQIRAGVSGIGAVVRLLVKTPEIGAIETSKATRPFCAVSHHMAKIALLGELNALAAADHSPIETNGRATPYRSTIDDHHGAFITKSLLGNAQIDGVEIEIVGRESGLLLQPDSEGSLPESQSVKFGPYNVDLVPIDMTSYARVKAA